MATASAVLIASIAYLERITVIPLQISSPNITVSQQVFFCLLALLPVKAQHVSWLKLVRMDGCLLRAHGTARLIIQKSWSVPDPLIPDKSGNKAPAKRTG